MKHFDPSFESGLIHWMEVLHDNLTLLVEDETSIFKSSTFFEIRTLQGFEDKDEEASGRSLFRITT